MKQNKKYALRKTAAYGLVSCAVGLMLVGSAPIQADESASSTDAISTVEDTSRITDVLKGQVQGYIQASKSLTGDDFIVDADVAPDKLPAIEHYKTIFNQIPASYRRLVTSVQFIHAEDAILGDTSSSRAIKIRANYIHPDQTPDFSDGLATMFHELGHVIDFASIQGLGDSLWSISRDPYMRNLLEKTYPNNVKAVYESFADAFGSWLKYRVLGESDSNMQDLYNQFDSLFGDFIFNSPYNNDDAVTEHTYKESTVFNWTGTFKSDKGEQLHDDAYLSAFYERVIHESNNSKTADQWTLVNRTFDHMEDLHLENHRFFGYGEPNTYAVGGNVFTVPGRIGDYYLASYGGNKMSRIGQNLWYTWQDNIYNEIGKQGATAGGVTNFVYRQKDTKITLRLIDSEHSETVYHTVEVPAFTNYEHNGIDTHVFDSFKSEGELLDNLPNEVALENDGKTIDIRLKKNEEFTTTVKVKNEKGDVLKEVQVTGKHDSNNRIDYGDLSEINKEYDTSKLPNTLRIDKDQSVVEYVVPSKEFTTTVKVKNEKGDVLKEVQVTGKHDSTNRIDYGDLSEINKEYDTSKLPNTLRIDKDQSVVEYVVSDKLYTGEWKVFDGYGSNLLHQGTVTGKYGEKLSDKLDLSQYKLDEFSKNRLNRYRFGIELVSGDTLPNKTMYTFFAPPKPVKKCNVYIQYVDDKDALVYPTKHLILEEGQTLRDYAISRSSLFGLPGDSLPDDNNRFNLGDTLELYGDFTLSNKEDVLNYTVNDSGDQIVKVIYNRKEVNGQATFKDALGREIHQTIDYQGKMYGKLSDETVEQIRQALLANKESHPDVLITVSNDKQYTDVDTFLNDLPNLRFGDGASRISVQYGTTITKAYDLATETSFTRLLIPDALGTYIDHFYKDVTPDKTVFNYYPKSSGDLYDVNTPYLSSEYDVEMYHNRSLVWLFIQSLGSLEQDEYTKKYLSMEVDTSNLPSNPTIHNTQPLTLTIHVAADGQVTVSDVQVGEKQGDSPVSLQVPGFDTYIVPQSLNNRGDEFLRLIEAIRNAEVSEETFKLDDGVDYQLGSGLTTKDIQTLKNNLRETGKLANFTEDSLDELVNQKLNAIKIGEPLTSKLQLDGNHTIQKVADQSFLFLLAPKIYHNKVKVMNEDGDVLLEKTLTTKFKDTVHYDMTEGLRTIENDYVTFDDLSGNWTATTENQEIIIHAKKRFVPKTETKQVKRLVRFHDGKQVVGEEEQVVTFTCTVTTDRKTDEVTYSDWESEHPQFDELKVAEKEDKTANVQSVPEKAVTAEDKDEIVDVYYGPKTSDSETQTKATIHVTYKYQDGTIYKEFDVQADKGSILDGSDLEMLPDDMNFTDEFITYEVKGDGTDVIERIVKKNTSDNGTQTDNPTTSDGGTQTDNPDTSDSETQTKATIHVVYRNQDGTIYKEFDIQADKGTILDGSDLEMLPDDMDFTDDFMFYEVKGDGMDRIERTVKQQTSDSGTQTDTPDSKDNGTQTDNPDTSDGSTQTKAEIKVVYKNADGTVYKEFVVNADKGSILDASDLEMLSDDMEFDDDFLFYEVKGDGNDAIERIVKKYVSDEGTQTETPETSDQGSQTDNPDTSDGSTQTDTPDSKDNGTQTKSEIKVVYKNADGTVYKEFAVNADKGAILDESDLEMLPDDMDFDDDFMFYEVKGDGSDEIVRIVKKHVSDEGTQAETPETNDGSTQTDEPSTSDNGTQTDNPFTNDQGSQTDTPSTNDEGSQTDNPSTNDQGTQTEIPETNDEGTQTEIPSTNEQGSQTDKPDVTDTGIQTKPDDQPVVQDVTIKVVCVDENGQTIQSFEVTKQVGSTIGLKDMQALDDSYVFIDFDKDVKGFVVDKDAILTLHVKKMQQVDKGIEPSEPTPQKDRIKADAKIDNVKKVSVGTNQLPKALVKEAKLPKAGSEDTAKVGIIGATMALLGGLIGIINRRKVHK